MSDRAATEVKFNELLTEFRNEILPLTYHNYNNFTAEEKDYIGHLCFFYCGLHALVNFAETAKSCLQEIETGIINDDILCCDKLYKDNYHGYIRLMRTGSKAFGEGSGGDDKSGCHGNVMTFVKEFLNEHRLRNLPFRSFRGSKLQISWSLVGQKIDYYCQ